MDHFKFFLDGFSKSARLRALRALVLYVDMSVEIYHFFLFLHDFIFCCLFQTARNHSSTVMFIIF